MLNLSFKQSARLGNLVMRSKRAENLIYVKTLRDACQTKCWKCKFNNMKRYLWNVKSWLLGEDWLELLEKRLKNNSGCALNKKNPFMVVLIIVRLPEGNKNNQYTSLSTRPKQSKKCLFKSLVDRKCKSNKCHKGCCPIALQIHFILSICVMYSVPCRFLTASGSACFCSPRNT